MLQGSLCRSHLWRRIPFSSFGKHFQSCPQFGRCCRGLRGGRQSCRQSLRNVGSFAVFGGASCWPGSRSTKRCSPPTYDRGNKSLENVIKLICIRTGRWNVLNLPFLFIHFWFSNEITPYFCEALRPLSEKKCFYLRLLSAAKSLRELTDGCICIAVATIQPYLAIVDLSTTCLLLGSLTY